MKFFHGLTLALLIIGGLNWGLVGAARFDLVATVFGMKFGSVNALSAVIYILVGISAIVQAFIALSSRARA